MNHQPHHPPRDRYYTRTFAVMTCLLLGLALFKIVQPFMGPMLWALFIAFLLHPLHTRLAARMGGRDQASALLLTLLAFVLILGPFTALSAAFAAQAGELLQSIQSTVAGQARGNVLALTNVPGVREGLDWLEESFSVDVAQLQAWARQGARE